MLIEVERSGLVESVHQASVVVMDTRFRMVASSGDINRPFFFRSSAKPFQAAVAQSLGIGLVPEQLAVACASHDGDPVHVAYVRQMLVETGLTEDALRCPPGWPLSTRAARRLASLGHRAPRPLWHNCSGKHAAMLAACVSQGWDTLGYLHPDHPLQRLITDRMRQVAGSDIEPVGIDGCGVPVHRATAVSLARAFVHLVTDPGYADVVTAMRRFPQLVSGVGNADSTVGEWLHAVAKRGAEGCMGVGVPGVGAIGLKIWDGAGRGMGPALFTVLERLGWIPDGIRDRLDHHLAVSVRGGGQTVGNVRVDFEPNVA